MPSPFYLVFLLVYLFFQSQLPSQPRDKWKSQAQDSFLALLNTHTSKDLKNLHIQLWTVSPGLTVTTAFGHSALRIFEGKEYGVSDYYLDFGVYDPSPGFLWRFMKGEANFFVNIIPTGSAYQTWDESGRGIKVTELNFNEKNKHVLLSNILTVYEENKNGYYYDNFSNNCVTFLREILASPLGKPLELKTMDAEKNTWRKRVLPYSTSIFWLNINETLLFDKDTDEIRNAHDLIYLPDDLLRSVEDSDLAPQTKILLKDRWGDRSGSSGGVWRILFAIIIIFSLPFPLLLLFERFSEVTFGLVSGIGGTVATLVYFFTSFSFMNETISWLIYSPIDFMFLKKYEDWKQKKILWSLVVIRLVMILTAMCLKFTIYPQQIDIILFLSSYFFLFYIIKRRADITTYLKLNP